MGIFSKLFKRKKKKNVTRNIDDILEQIQADGQSRSIQDYKQKAEHAMLGKCEEIIETMRELEDAKKEYRIVTQYLKDIQKIKEFPEDVKKEMEDLASKVILLNRAKDEYLKTTKRLSDEQYAQIEQEADEIPDAIRRLEANETYEAAIRRDMSYLEGEKQEWMYCKEEIKTGLKRMRIGAYLLFATFVIMLAVILVLHSLWDIDTKWLFTLLALATTATGFFLYFKQQKDLKQLKQCEVNMNHAITLENKVKYKYVNTKNAVDYVCEKYHVHNSKELTYIWEQYLGAMREKERYRQTNAELDEYCFELIGLLKEHELYDAQTWLNKPDALCDSKEMVEVQHNLITRRQKLRERMDYHTKNIQAMRKEIEQTAEEQKYLVPELKEIIDSIDNLTTEL